MVSTRKFDQRFEQKTMQSPSSNEQQQQQQQQQYLQEQQQQQLPVNFDPRKRSSISFGGYRPTNNIKTYDSLKSMDRNGMYYAANNMATGNMSSDNNSSNNNSSNDNSNGSNLSPGNSYINLNGNFSENPHGIANLYNSLSLMPPFSQQNQNSLGNWSFQTGNANGNGNGNGNNMPLCSYRSKFPLYGLDWSSNNAYGDLVSLGSYRENNVNDIQILQNTNSTGGFPEWEKICEQKTLFPVCKIQWDPSLASGTVITPTGESNGNYNSTNNNSGEGTSRSTPPLENSNNTKANLATCSDSLRIWTLQNKLDATDNNNNIHRSKNNEIQDKYELNETLNLSLWKYYNKQGLSGVLPVGGDTKVLGSLPPVTSCDWNKKDPSIIISSSIDTTCTVWDLNRINVRTQLIAHDSEVFDVKFLTNSSHLFATCGNDGSARVFDLRSLEHSSIIYESPDALNSPTSGESISSTANHRNNALLRLETCPFDINVVATFASNSNSVMILDMRYPGQPVTVLQKHSGNVNSIKWHPSKRGILTSCSDDCQVLVWDTTSTVSCVSPINSSSSICSPNSNHNNSETPNSVNSENSFNRTTVSPPVDANSTTATTTSSTSNINNSTNNQPVDQNRDSFAQGKKIVYPAPILCYNDNVHEEINNIVWRGGQSNGDWLGFVRGKNFQSIKC